MRPPGLWVLVVGLTVWFVSLAGGPADIARGFVAGLIPVVIAFYILLEDRL